MAFPFPTGTILVATLARWGNASRSTFARMDADFATPADVLQAARAAGDALVVEGAELDDRVMLSLHAIWPPSRELCFYGQQLHASRPMGRDILAAACRDLLVEFASAFITATSTDEQPKPHRWVN